MYCAVLVRFPIRFPGSPGTVVSLRVFNFYLNIFHLRVRWLHSIFGPGIFSTQTVIVILQVKCHHSVNFTCSGLYNWLVNGLAMDSRKNLRRTPLVPNSGRSHCSCGIQPPSSSQYEHLLFILTFIYLFNNPPAVYPPSSSLRSSSLPLSHLYLLLSIQKRADLPRI